MTAAVLERPTAAPSAVETAPQMIDWTAKNIVPGVYLSNWHADESGEWRLMEPLKVVAIEDGTDCDGSPLVWLTVDNGWRLPFEPDFLVEVQCVRLPCPPWCTSDEVDRHDGTVRHGGPEEVVLVTDETGREHECYAGLSRWDDPDATIAEDTSVSVVFDNTNGFDISPAAARELAAALGRVAAAAEPNLVYVESTKLGDQVFVDGEWQTVTLLVHDGRRGEVALYTVSEDDAAIREPLGTLIDVRTSGKTTASAAGSPDLNQINGGTR